MWWIAFANLNLQNHPCIPGLCHIWLWYIIFVMYYWIWLLTFYWEFCITIKNIDWFFADSLTGFDIRIMLVSQDEFGSSLFQTFCTLKKFEKMAFYFLKFDKTQQWNIRLWALDCWECFHYWFILIIYYFVSRIICALY
jgi:hypothetical protein